MKKESRSFIYTKRLAFASLLSALSFIFMYVGTLTGVFDLCATVFAALLCAFAVIEMGGLWPWLIAAVTSVLCLIFLPDKFCALEYVVLGGIYPILKSIFEIFPRVLSWGAKIVSFNVLLTACLAVGKFIFLLTDEWVAFNVVVYGMANVFFIVFDIALTTFISYYIKRLRSKLKISL